MDRELLNRLKQFDTPTICNALEHIDYKRRYHGFTRHLCHSFNGEVGPIIGYAKTATMRSLDRPDRAPARLKEHRLSYYRFVSEGDLPKIAVMQDLDGIDAGIGPFWGEFNTRIHQSLGCVGIVTDGSMRDIALLPKDILILSRGPRPSHAHVHVVDYDVQVNVFGMYVKSNDLVHADIHGAVAFPPNLVEDVIANAKEFVKSEEAILTACRERKLTYDEVAELYMKR